MASVGSIQLFDSATVSTSAASEKKSVQLGQHSFIGYLKVTGAVALTTFDCDIEHSPDGVNWYVLKSFTQLAANGNEIVQISNANVHVLPNVRINMTLVGTSVVVDCRLHYDGKV